MQALRLLFSPFGRLGPKAFVIAVIVVDAAGAASQWLTVLGATANNKLLLFAAVQARLDLGLVRLACQAAARRRPFDRARGRRRRSLCAFGGAAVDRGDGVFHHGADERTPTRSAR